MGRWPGDIGGALPTPPGPRFWRKVAQGGAEDCWLWIAGRDPQGYGNFGLTPTYVTKAHRAAWIFTYGEIPSGMNVLHKCDNPPCVNPRHLFLGTQKDNGLDMAAKGRASTHGRKLTPDQVREIRSEVKSGTRHAELAQRFGTSVPNISTIANRRSWITLDPETEDLRG